MTRTGPLGPVRFCTGSFVLFGRRSVDRTLTEKIWQLVEPLVAAQGYEVVEIEAHSGRNGLLRIYLDGPEGISIDKCAEFSRAISHQLDVEDPMATAYTLEVSSPGLDRPLRKPTHFEKHLNQTIAAKIATGDRPRKVRGVLTAVDAQGFDLQPEGAAPKLSVKFTELVSAHVVFDFSTAFKKKPGAQAPRNQ